MAKSQLQLCIKYYPLIRSIQIECAMCNNAIHLIIEFTQIKLHYETNDFSLVYSHFFATIEIILLLLLLSIKCVSKNKVWRFI